MTASIPPPGVHHASVATALALGEEGILDLAGELAEGLSGGAADVRADRASRRIYATDASIYQMEPVCVVFPRTTEDVQYVLGVASLYGVPVLPRGGGTSLAGQGVNHAIVLDFTPHMGEVLELNAAEGWARVQPGLVLDALNRRAAPHGLHYPIDPSTRNRATIGGGIGNNSCGAHSPLYGKTLDQVLSLTVVLSDGSRATLEPLSGDALESRRRAAGLEGALYREIPAIARRNARAISERFPRIQRRVSGYNLDELLADHVDLSRLVVGSEGTLAVVTEARVKLAPLPPRRALAAVHFASVVEAAEATVAALAHRPAAVELIDDTIVRRCRESPGYRALADYIQGSPGALLLIELFGEEEEEIQGRLSALALDFSERGLGYHTVTELDPARQRRMWGVREAGLGLLMSVTGDAKPLAFVEDAAVAPERLPEFVRRFQQAVARHGTTAGYYGHASVGCLHIRPMVNIKEAAGLRTMEALASEIADLVLEFGGSLSGEHGDGILRGAFVERMFGPELTEAFRAVKRTFDPRGLLNPGKIVDTPPFASNLRLSPATENREPRTAFDYSAEGGFARAVELCNGQGTCRKEDGGMCPSYMVTRDEEHSTRGRANLLRAVLAGDLPRTALAGPRLHEALDLCVECKACASECPSGVDMARLKSEVLALYHEQHGIARRDRLFAHVHRLAAWGSRAAPLVNAFGRTWPVRHAAHRFLGVHHRRRLPPLARRGFRRWFSTHTRGRDPARLAPRGDAVLFDDTFTRFVHPEVGAAATRVLEALGYRVTLVRRLGCCGRPAISKGLLETARRWARRNVDALAPYARRGVPIVGTEPSCLLALRDEYPDLLPGEAAVAVAREAVLLDELVARAAAEDPGAVSALGPGAGASGPVLVHGHCHQKALVGIEPTLDALAACGYEPSLIDSACCGMAGSFGFEAEHYEISRAMGERRLFPAVERAPGDAEIAVTGVSCRQQITHFTTRSPLHSAELLARALCPEPGAPQRDGSS